MTEDKNVFKDFFNQLKIAYIGTRNETFEKKNALRHSKLIS